MSLEKGGIISYRVTEDEYKVLDHVVQELFTAGKLTKPTVNALSKKFTFALSNQFLQVEAGLKEKGQKFSDFIKSQEGEIKGV